MGYEYKGGKMMKKLLTSKMLCLLLALGFLFSTGLTANADTRSITSPVINTKIVKITSVSLNKTTDNIKVGGSDTLIATLKPLNATNKSIKWSSSDAAIVKVDNGKLTAIKAGTATIKVTTVDGSKTASCIVTVTSDNKVVIFKDVNLEKRVREIINKPTGKIYKKDVENITYLSDSMKCYTSIIGIENLTNLQYLDIRTAKLSDISPLKNLVNLKSIRLTSNMLLGFGKLKDISPLIGLKNLEHLDLQFNPINNLNPLTNLKKLKGLELYATTTKNANSLSGLTNLEYLDLQNNQITNITPLKSLSKLKELSLVNNAINETDQKILKKALPNCKIYFGMGLS